MSEAQILVVEDENIVAKDIQNRLKNMGYQVPTVVATGEEAVIRAGELLPDLVLMDIMLKGAVDGVTAAEQIRIRFNIPVIYLTAYSDEGTLARAKITEPFGYLLKPFEERELYTTIEMALYKHKMDRKLRENEQWLSTTLKGIGDAVIATDRNGRIAFMNPVAEALTGWRQSEAMGLDLMEVFNVIDEKTRTHIESPSLRVLQGKSPVRLSYNIQLVGRDGTATPIDDSCAPITNDKGNVIGVVVAFRDITDRRLAEEVLRQHAGYLTKRIKELQCLYSVFRVAENPEVELEEVLRQVPTVAVPAWRYPEIAAVCVTWGDRRFATENWRETSWRQCAELHAFGEKVGSLDVVYLDERPAADEGPFLKEERSLINAIAAQLGAVIERKSSETELRRKIEDLERQNTELKDLMTTTLHPVHESGS